MEMPSNKRVFEHANEKYEEVRVPRNTLGQGAAHPWEVAVLQ